MDKKNKQKDLVESDKDFQGSTGSGEEILILESLEVKDLYERLILAQYKVLAQYDEAAKLDEIEVDSDSEIMSHADIFDFTDPILSGNTIEADNDIDLKQLIQNTEPENPTLDSQQSEKVEPFQIASDSYQASEKGDDGSMDAEFLRLFNIIEEEAAQPTETPNSERLKEEDVDFKFMGVADEKITPPVFDNTQRAINESNYSIKCNSGPNKTNQNNFIPLGIAITGFVILTAGLVGLTFYTKGLQSQMETQSSAVVAYNDSAKTIEIHKRIGILVAEVNKLNSAVFHPIGKGTNSSNARQNQPISLDLSSLNRMASSPTQQLWGTFNTKITDPVTSEHPVANSSKRIWTVKFVSVGNKNVANQLQAEFQSKGVPAGQQSVEIDGKTIYRLGVGGFTSRSEANDYGGKAIKELGIDSYWVSQ